MAFLFGRKILLGEWVEHTPDPEHNALIAAMYAIEAREGERRGWDRMPSVWTAHLAHIDTGTVLVDPVDRRQWQRGAANPADDLLRIAAEVGVPKKLPPRTQYADTANGIAAVVFMCEMWGAPAGSLPEELEARRVAGERVIHQMSDRVEMRSIVAVDINGLGCSIMRPRGDQPSPPLLFEREMMVRPEDEGPGRVPRALFALAVAARESRWPKR